MDDSELRDRLSEPIDLLGFGVVALPEGLEAPGPDWVPAEDQGPAMTVCGFPVVWMERPEAKPDITPPA